MAWFNVAMDFLKLLFRKWLVVAHAIGNFQAQVLLSFFYIIFFLPIGLVFRFFSDPLRLRSHRRQGFGGQAGQALRRKSNFEKWEHPKENLDQARKQY